MCGFSTAELVVALFFAFTIGIALGEFLILHAHRPMTKKLEEFRELERISDSTW